MKLNESENIFREQIINNSVEVNVIINSKKNNIVYDELKDNFKLYIKEKAENNKANSEIIKYLSKISQNKIKIIIGKRSKKKIVTIKK